MFCALYVFVFWLEIVHILVNNFLAKQKKKQHFRRLQSCSDSHHIVSDHASNVSVKFDCLILASPHAIENHPLYTISGIGEMIAGLVVNTKPRMQRWSPCETLFEVDLDWWNWCLTIQEHLWLLQKYSFVDVSLREPTRPVKSYRC